MLEKMQSFLKLTKNKVYSIYIHTFLSVLAKLPNMDSKLKKKKLTLNYSQLVLII